METLGLYPLSVILSFSSESDGGVSLLLTHRRFARQVLPLFRLPPNYHADDLVVLLGPPSQQQQHRKQRKRQQHRHRFVVAPVQDPVFLLERLNTRRLAQRRRRGRNNSILIQPAAAAAGLSTKELAQKEWNEQTHCRNSNNNSNTTTTTIPPELELLRFLDHPTAKDNIDAHCQDLIQAGVTLLVSYPRSGNTLVRTLLERTTGIVTGSDTRPDRSLSRQLAEQHGLVGEGIVVGCPFVKTHWPERPGNRPFAGQRAVLLVRNPYDAMDSYWNMNATKSHTQTLQPSVYQQYREQWHGLVRNEIHVWMRFLDYWIRDCPVPVLLVRFEDLIRDPARQLTRILEFALLHHQQQQQQPLDDFWKQRIAYVTGTANNATTITTTTTESLGSYRPRTASQGSASIGKSLRKGHYTAELLDYIHTAAAAHPYTNYLRAFGYDMLATAAASGEQQEGFPTNFNQTASSTATTVPEVATTLSTQMNHALLQSTSPVVRVNTNNSSNAAKNGQQPPSSSPEVRPSNCPYGRLLYKWRHSVTDTDAVPLPTEEQ